MINQPNFDGVKMKMPTENLSETAPGTTTSKSGPVILILGLALVAVLGGLIYWYNLQSKVVDPAPTSLRPALENNAEPETPTATARVENFAALSTSDELTAIEADVESTYLGDLDVELSQIDATLKEASAE